jgi:hypothetical protein
MLIASELGLAVPLLALQLALDALAVRCVSNQRQNGTNAFNQLRTVSYPFTFSIMNDLPLLAVEDQSSPARSASKINGCFGHRLDRTHLNTIVAIGIPQKLFKAASM